MSLGAACVLVLLLGLSCRQSWGQTPDVACPISFPVKPPANGEARRQELQRLDGLVEACNSRADYFAWVGVLWLTEKQPQRAATALEKALLLDPDLPGAELDYAQALAELGQQASARQLVQSVLARPDVPRALYEWLTGSESDWAENQWQRRGFVQTLLGHESNLNSGPSSSSLNLTLPGGPVPVLLAESELPRAGTTSLTTVALEASRPLGPGRLTLSGEGTLRATPGDAGDKLQWIAAAATMTQPLSGFDAGMRLGATRLWLGGVALYEENALKLFLERPVSWLDAACRYGAGVDYSARSYPASSTLDGRYAGAQLGMGCQRAGAGLSAIVQWGRDRAQDPLRLGGDQQRHDFLLTASHAAGPGLLTLSAQWSRLADADIYSPLLGGVPREILRRGGRLQYEYPVSNQLTMLAYLEKTSQNSNIELFVLENRAFYMGLRWSSK